MFTPLQQQNKFTLQVWLGMEISTQKKISKKK